MTTSFDDRLKDLPREIIDQITSYFDRQDLLQFNLTARWCQDAALPLIWREVELIDCQTVRSVCPQESDEDTSIEDEHDDTPIIKKLLVLATNPRIAECVQTLDHRCHLPPRSVFDDLQRCIFAGQTLSYDPRLITLVRMAAHNLRNLHTLRIVHGHPRLIEALVRSLFDRERIKATHIRRLWLENCRLSEPLEAALSSHRQGLALSLDFSRLMSLRLRRLHMPTIPDVGDPNFRNDIVFRRTPRNDECAYSEWAVGRFHTMPLSRRNNAGPEASQRRLLRDCYKLPNMLDDAAWEAISKQVRLPIDVQQATIASHEHRSIWAYNAECSDEDEAIMKLKQVNYSADLQAIYMKKKAPPSACVRNLMQQCWESLTCLTLDWIWMTSRRSHLREPWFQEVFHLRFPQLRAFQLRNFTTADTELPRGIYLLDRCHWPSCHDQTDTRGLHDHECPDCWLPLEFLEAHPKLQCLAWPLDRFFDMGLSEKPRPRVQKVIDTLATNLTDLRVDALLAGDREPHTETVATPSREHRRLFIRYFAPHMSNVKNIKISGMVPLDERREILRALHRCSLQRISLIGVSSSIGNTWGFHDVDHQDNIAPGQLAISSPEDKDAIWRLGSKVPAEPNDDFVPTYGWAGTAPMITTIAGCFGGSLRELKLCGYIGAPVLLTPTPITTPMLYGLRFMHHLEVLTMSLWINTFFEDEYRDQEILDFWKSTRDPTTTALVIMNPSAPERGSWQERIMALEPGNLATTVTALFGPHLSEQAKHKGVLVRASFAVGTGNLHELDVHIGKDDDGKDTCQSFRGPREEFEPERRKEKLNSRRWF